MKNNSQWWDESWNPVTGCTPQSEGCAHCYAKTMHERFYQSTKFEKVVLHPERLGKIDKTRPKVIFVDSVSDLFHEDVPFEFITEVFSAMQRNPLHTFVVLTKRAKRMFEYFSWAKEENPEWRLFYPLENLWLGVTCETQARANERIPFLLKTQAKHRFVSVEPMLEAVDPFGTGMPQHVLSVNSIDLVICGGETGTGARLMRPEWARKLRDQCREAKVPLFFKQWGEWAPDELDDIMVRTRSSAVGRKLDGVEWNDLPWRKVISAMKSNELQLSLMEGLK